MAIRGAEGLSQAELEAELEAGGRVVVFSWAVSVCVLSFSQDTQPMLLRRGESALLKGLPYTLLSLTLGWWGIPFGPILTGAALINNLKGGHDVTHQLLRRPEPEPEDGDPRTPWQRHKDGDL